MTIGYDIKRDLWIVRNGAECEEMTAEAFALRYGITPLSYIQQGLNNGERRQDHQRG